jgi:hypothetical protein
MVVENGVLVHPITLFPIIDSKRGAIFKFKFKLKIGLVAPVASDINIQLGTDFVATCEDCVPMETCSTGSIEVGNR